MGKLMLFIVLFICTTVKSQISIQLETGNHKLINTPVYGYRGDLKDIEYGLESISSKCKSKCKNEYSYQPEIIQIYQSKDSLLNIVFHFSCENVYGARGESKSIFFYDNKSNMLIDNDIIGFYRLDITKNDINEHFKEKGRVYNEKIRMEEERKQREEKLASELRKQREENDRVEEENRIFEKEKADTELKSANKIRNRILLGFGVFVIVILSL